MKKISVQSIFMLCLANGLLTWSVEYISGGIGLYYCSIGSTICCRIHYLVIQMRKITRWMVVGLIVGFAGIITIFYDYLAQLQDKSFVFGVVLALLSTLSWSFGTVYTSKQKPPIDILFNVGLQMLIAGILVLIVCAVTGKYISIADVTRIHG